MAASSANTPSAGQPISILDVKRIFGQGLNSNPGDDLQDYHGVTYWSTIFPYTQGKFDSNTASQLSLNDFYDKTNKDPFVPGSFTDLNPGSNKKYTVPIFRNNIKLEIWGAGGGAGAADHDSVRPSGTAGGTSTLTVSITGASLLSASGGGGGTSGYRYGNQNGSGGGGGVASNTGSFGAVTIVKTNGNSGGSGDAGGGQGAVGGSSPNGGAGGARGGHNTSPRQDGKPGTAPGGGGGSGGDSDFQSGKNANPNRSAGGSGGSGAYASLTFTRAQMAPGSVVTYNIGSGGNGSNGNQGKGADGANGGFKITWS